MFDRMLKRAPAIDMVAMDDGFPFSSLASEIALPSSAAADDLPITAVMNALSGRESEAHRRREEVELSIRTHWAALCRLVVEYNSLAEEFGGDPVPTVARMAPRPVKRGLVPPPRRARQVA